MIVVKDQVFLDLFGLYKDFNWIEDRMQYAIFSKKKEPLVHYKFISKECLSNQGCQLLRMELLKKDSF